jgi:hypothetical protein
MKQNGAKRQVEQVKHKNEKLLARKWRLTIVKSKMFLASGETIGKILQGKFMELQGWKK